MDTERIQQRFASVVRLAKRPGSPGEATAALEAAQRMIERYPWLRDMAFDFGFAPTGSHTEEMKSSANKKPWTKPATKAGVVYKQCGKPACHCMQGGKWHGPYEYRSKRQGKTVRSEYQGKV